VSEKSYSQKKREKYDYRKHYLDHNPGILGSVYICSQCGKLLSRKEMEVDHIFPVSKWWSINHILNCVSICSSCNKSKSNRVTWKMSLKGVLAKLGEETYIAVQNLIVLIFRLTKSVFIILVKTLISPIRSGTGVQKFLCISTLIYIIGCMMGGYFLC
jgi:hypothetical protein